MYFKSAKIYSINLTPSFEFTWRYSFEGCFFTMKEEIEIWKDVKGCEGSYEVSSLGRIKSLRRIVLRGGKYPFYLKETILSQTTNQRGYKRVILSINALKSTKIVHILVAESFLNHDSKNTELIVVDHINNIKSDNRLTNLQLITHRENVSKDRKNTSSKFTGVCFKKSRNTWQAAIRIDGKIKHLGYSKNEQIASDLYQNALKKINKKIQI